MVAKRVSIILLFLGLITAEASAQYSVLRKKIDFDADAMRFEDVILSLADRGGFSFSYNPDMLPVDSVMTLHVENTSLKTVLVTMMGKELEMKQSGNHLVILRTKYTINYGNNPGDKSNTISGTITDSKTGATISGATVFDVKSLNSAVTDADGYYKLEIPINEPVIGISVTRSDVQDTTFVVHNRQQELDIPVVTSKGLGDSFSGGPAHLDSLGIVKFVTADEGILRTQGISPSLFRTAQISFVPFVGTNLKMSGIITNNYSLNVLAGYNGATQGIEIGGLVNVTRYYVHGVQIAGLANAIGQETNGIQLAGLFNTNLGVVRGVQIAGVNNLVLDSLKGLQLSGVNNIISGRTDGVQIAGVNNFALRDVDGVQLAGVSNIAVRDVNLLQVAGVINLGKDISGTQIAGVLNGSYGNVKGAQIAGVMNTSRSVRTVQLAGVMNVAADTVFGAQIAGLINFGRKNRGFQLALVNIGDSVSGVSIGLVNLFLRGYNKVELFGTDVLPYNARLVLGTQRFYNIFGLGTEGFETNSIWGYTYGFGTSFRMGRKKRHALSLNITGTDLQDDDTWIDRIIPLVRTELVYSYSFGKRFAIFGGPVLNNLFYKEEYLEDDPFILNIAPWTLYERSNNVWNVQGWIGFSAGIRFL